MSSSKAYKDFILEQLSELKDISIRPMMGEFLLYYNGVLFGGIYDNRLLIKKTNSNKSCSLPEEIPYEKGKSMYMVDNVDDKDYLTNLIKTTYNDLK